MVEGSSDLRYILKEFVARLKNSPMWLDVTTSIVNGLSGSQRPAVELLEMLEQVVALHPSQWLGYVKTQPSWSEADLSNLLHAAVRLHEFESPCFFSLARECDFLSKTSYVQNFEFYLRFWGWLLFCR